MAERTGTRGAAVKFYRLSRHRCIVHMLRQLSVLCVFSKMTTTEVMQIILHTLRLLTVLFVSRKEYNGQGK